MGLLPTALHLAGTVYFATAFVLGVAMIVCGAMLAKSIENKLDLFRSIGVTPFSVSYVESNKAKYYQTVLKKIKSNLK